MNSQLQFPLAGTLAYALLEAPAQKLFSQFTLAGKDLAYLASKRSLLLGDAPHRSEFGPPTYFAAESICLFLLCIVVIGFLACECPAPPLAVFLSTSLHGIDCSVFQGEFSGGGILARSAISSVN
jgi:hypothetical protein